MQKKYKEEMDIFLRSVMSKEWNERRPNSKLIRLSVWCLIYYGVTLEQLIRLSPNEKSSANVERIYMNRQIKKKYFRTLALATTTQAKQIVYIPTKEWMKEAKEKITLLCEQEKKKGYPYISEETLNYYYKRFLRKNDYQGLLHQICARDIGTYLVENGKDYTYCTEVGIGLNGQIFPFQTQKSLVDRTNTRLISDGYGTFKDFSGQYEYKVHVEQDMIQQHSNVIKDKITNYCDYVFVNTTDIAQLILAFSVFVPSSASDMRTLPKRNGYGRTAKRYYSLYNFAAYCSGNDNMTLTELSVLMEKYLETYPEQYVKNALSMIYDLQKVAPNMTMKELQIYLSSSNDAMDKQIQTATAKLKQQKFYNRKESIFTAVLGEDKLMKYLLNGLSIYCVPNYEPSLRESTFFKPESIQNITEVLMKGNYLTQSVPTYTPADKGEQITFRNHLQYGDVHVYAENITYDLGARIRVQKYLQNAQWTKKGILLCICDKEDAIARKLYYSSPYGNNPVGPLKVLLLSEDDLKRKEPHFLNNL